MPSSGRMDPEERGFCDLAGEKMVEGAVALRQEAYQAVEGAMIVGGSTGGALPQRPADAHRPYSRDCRLHLEAAGPRCLPRLRAVDNLVHQRVPQIQGIARGGQARDTESEGLQLQGPARRGQALEHVGRRKDCLEPRGRRRTELSRQEVTVDAPAIEQCVQLSHRLGHLLVSLGPPLGQVHVGAAVERSSVLTRCWVGGGHMIHLVAQAMWLAAKKALAVPISRAAPSQQQAEAPWKGVSGRRKDIPWLWSPEPSAGEPRGWHHLAAITGARQGNRRAEPTTLHSGRNNRVAGREPVDRGGSLWTECGQCSAA